MNMHATVQPQGAWAQEGRSPRIAIIGAGMSGIAAVVKLREAGYTDLTVYEKASKVGGTWRENRYPGLSCDVPSHWYRFRFNRNPEWTHRYPYGPEIQAYMEATAEKFDVLRDVKFNTPVKELVYEGPLWRLETQAGEVEYYDVVISASGILHKRSIPAFEGLGSFEGPNFHTADWQDGIDLTGKRVGIIGNGSTSAQIIGAIGHKVKSLRLFQRTAQWMLPLPQKKYSRFYRWLLRKVPVLMDVVYMWHLKSMENMFVKATVGSKFWQKVLSKNALKNLEDNVPDPVKRAKLTPDHQAGCKRMIFCSDFYPAISREGNDVITDGIERIEPKGVRTKDGTLHELDVLIYATGFDAGAFILPVEVYGEDKVNLREVWDGAPRAHRSVAVPGFPNFWFIEGPTGPVGNMSLILVSECQVDYIISMLNKMKADHLAAIAPKPEAFKAYNEQLMRDVEKTIWVTGGCDSWYFDKSGKPNLYPYEPKFFRQDMKNPQYSEYRLIESIPKQSDPIAAE